MVHVGFQHDLLFQADDVIRGGHVPGVQTCALPISSRSIASSDLAIAGSAASSPTNRYQSASGFGAYPPPGPDITSVSRSAERRVGTRSTTHSTTRARSQD